ncbi:MAG: pilin [Patescibacteria group bacterium]
MIKLKFFVLLLFFVSFFVVTSPAHAQQCMTDGSVPCAAGFVCDCTGEPGCGQDATRGECKPVPKPNGSLCGANTECTSGYCNIVCTVPPSSLPSCIPGSAFDNKIDPRMSSCLEGTVIRYQCGTGYQLDISTKICNALPTTNSPAPAPSDSTVPTPPDSSSGIANGLFLFLVNPLTVTGNKNPLAGIIQGFTNVTQTFTTPAGFLNALMPFLFSIAGIILFVMIIWGGFEMIYGAADTKAQEAGKQRITAALIGFTLLFISYWIAQILQAIFGVNILG